MSEISGAVSYYDEHADMFASQATDEQKNSLEYMHNLPSILRLTRDIPGRVLDFGCGAGNFTSALVQSERTIEGCDASPQLVAYAQTHYPDLPFFQYDGFSSRQGEKYRMIVAKLVFHYIQPLEVVLLNIAKQLEPSGVLCYSVPHPDKSSALVGGDVEEATYTDEVGSFGLKLEMVHRTKKRYIDLLDNAGLKITNEETVEISGKPKRLNILAVKQ